MLCVVSLKFDANATDSNDLSDKTYSYLYPKLSDYFLESCVDWQIFLILMTQRIQFLIINILKITFFL